MKDKLVPLYQESIRDNWDCPAVSDYGTGVTLTYGELARKLVFTHSLFEEVGINPGDKVALIGKNSVTWISVYMAALTYGAVIVPILPDFNPVDAQHIINHSGAQLLFVEDHIWEHLEHEALPNIKLVMSLDSAGILSENRRHLRKSVSKILAALPGKFDREHTGGFGPADVRFRVPDANDVAELNYTSGTTGFSKGVMLTYRNLWGNVDFGVNAHIYFRGARVLSFLPLAHAYGCTFDLLVPLATGTHITVLGKMPTPAVLLKAFKAVRPHLILCVPLILEKIYRRAIAPALEKNSVKRMLALPVARGIVRRRIRAKLMDVFGGELKQVIVGGAPLNPEVENFLLSVKFPVTVGYGMTECGPLISYTPAWEFIAGSAGRTLPGVMESKVDSPDPSHIPGEILVRGINVMKGYYKNRAATEAVLDADGWLHTGDMGTRTADGTLFLRGRNKTMILSASGQNIYPEEIEAKLNNLPYVGESLVVERGKHLVAIVYPDYEAMDKSGLTAAMLPPIMEKVREQLNRLVAPYERIDRIQLHPVEFEKTPKRSIKRFLYS